MKHSGNTMLVSLLWLLLPFAGAVAGEEDTSSFASAISSGEAGISGRYRYEYVDQDNSLKNANASTLRLRLNYRTSPWKGWSAFAEFDHVFHVLVDDFNSGGGTSPNRIEYSVVADPDGSDLNQLYLDLDSSDNWKYRFGRQRILLDNERFVGGVGWRQNEQTFDALTLNTTAITNTRLSYSYVNRVRRIFGESVPAGKERLDGHLFNAKITLNKAITLTPYLYSLDYADAVSNSSITLGARAAGSHPFGSGSVDWLAEYARQSDAADNPVSYNADYVHLNAAYAAGNGMAIGLGYEVLGSDSGAGTAFSTPLATLHAFNGWADQFLSTPGEGLEDLYATVKFTLSRWNLTAVYHDFSSDSGGFDYGGEIDLSGALKLSDHYGLLLKAAFFDADASSPLANVDTTKFWIMLTASY